MLITTFIIWCSISLVMLYTEVYLDVTSLSFYTSEYYTFDQLQLT